MSAQRQDPWIWIGLFLAVGATSAVLGCFIFLAHDQDSASALIQTVTAVVGLAGGVVGWLVRRARQGYERAGTLSLEQAANELAEQVRLQWESAATARRLRHPAPVPIRWAEPTVAIAGPLSDALGERFGVRRLAPLEGVNMATTPLSGRDVADLLDVYGRLASGRLVIIGSPGSGKTATAVRLVLATLEHRALLSHAKRSTAPVPVILSPNGWDPMTQRLEDWLAGRLTTEYPLLSASEYGPNASGRLVRKGLITIILDGLDDVAEPARSKVLTALDEQATFRVVVLSRSAEMAAASAERHLSGAVAVELQPVEASEAAAYLSRCQAQPLTPAWSRLIKQIRNNPTCAVSRAFESPLMLTLVRDTYKRDDRVDDS